jgi:uncharacterized protein YaaR (DUF327 family)
MILSMEKKIVAKTKSISTAELQYIKGEALRKGKDISNFPTYDEVVSAFLTSLLEKGVKWEDIKIINDRSGGERSSYAVLIVWLEESEIASEKEINDFLKEIKV